MFSIQSNCSFDDCLKLTSHLPEKRNNMKCPSMAQLAANSSRVKLSHNQIKPLSPESTAKLFWRHGPMSHLESRLSSSDARRYPTCKQPYLPMCRAARWGFYPTG